MLIAGVKLLIKCDQLLLVRYLTKYKSTKRDKYGDHYNQANDNQGVHVNVSGAGVTKHAKNRDGAVKLLEWLSSEKAQNLFADSNMEYPVNPRVKPHDSVAGWGSFNQNLIKVERAGELQRSSIMLMDRAGYR